MTAEQNRGFLLDLRNAAQKELEQLDQSQGARRQPVRERIRLYDALLQGDGPGDDLQYAQSLRGLIFGGEHGWVVRDTQNEAAVLHEARRLLEFLEKRAHSA